MNTSICRACGKPIIFAVVGNKEARRPSRMPLDPQPDPEGNVAVYRDASRRLTGRVLGKDDAPLGYERLMMPHFATCTGRGSKGSGKVTPIKPPELPENVTSLSRWKQAQAEHHKQQRRSRSRPRPKPITGIRIPPPPGGQP